jgi:predicted dinucleotide-utilizing enzyme
LLDSHPLDAIFWLNCAKSVLIQSDGALTEESLRMLAVCSDQANRHKLLLTKGAAEGDTLALLRAMEARLLAGPSAGEATP